MLGRREAAGQQGSGAVLARLASVLRQVSGMPDYMNYVKHVRHCHPDMPVLTQREHYTEYLNTRYRDGPTRCC